MENKTTSQKGVLDTDETSSCLLLTCWSTEMDNCAVVFEHVHFFNVVEGLHAYIAPKYELVHASEIAGVVILTKLLDGGLDLLVLSDLALTGLLVVDLQNSSLSAYKTMHSGLVNL